jgi:hypothetical protein
MFKNCRTSKILIQNQQGFTTLIVLFLVLAVLGFAAIVQTLGAALLKNAVLFHCRSALIESQKRSQDLISELIEKNADSISLHIEEEIAQMDYLAAKASGNMIMVARARQKVIEIQRKLKALDKFQKNLIAESNRSLIAQQLTAQRTVQNFLRQHSYAKKISANHFVIVKTQPKTAVAKSSKHPVAPTYKILNSINSDQEQSLFIKYEYKSPFNIKSLKLIGQEETCTVSTQKTRTKNLFLTVNSARF